MCTCGRVCVCVYGCVRVRKCVCAEQRWFVDRERILEHFKIQVFLCVCVCVCV